MADIRLPNGTILANVPDGTTQEELVSRLQAGGHDTSWYKAPDKSYANRVLTESLPAVGNTIKDMITAIPAGAASVGHGVYEAGAGLANTFASQAAPGLSDDQRAQARDAGLARMGNAPLQAAQTFGNVMQWNQEEAPRFRGAGVEASEAALGHLMETGNEKLGAFAERQVGRPYLPPVAHLFTENRPEDNNPLVRMGGEVTGNLMIPIPGVKAAGKIPHIGSEWRANRAKVQAEAKRADLMRQIRETEDQLNTEFREKAVQQDWVQNQEAMDMGPNRPTTVMRDPMQRDFWEHEHPSDMAEPGRGQGGEIPFESAKLIDDQVGPPAEGVRPGSGIVEPQRDMFSDGPSRMADTPLVDENGRPWNEQAQIEAARARGEQSGAQAELERQIAVENGMDMPERKPGFLQDTVEKLWDPERLSIEKSPDAGIRSDSPQSRQRGAIHIETQRSAVGRQTADTLHAAFVRLKQMYPRFANNTDIEVVSQESWNAMIDRSRDQIHPADLQRYKSGEVPLTYDGEKIYANAESPFFHGKTATRLAGVLAHELTHGMQDLRGRMLKWQDNEALWQKPVHERPWEQQAISAEKTAIRKWEKLSRKQGGFIHPDLLRLGFDKLRTKMPLREALEHFAGTFDKTAMSHIRAAAQEQGNKRLVMLAPAEFRRLVEGTHRPLVEERKHGNIRKGLDTPEGLRDAPYLEIAKRADGQWEVINHEGRHRSDMFGEQGLDRMPVILHFTTNRGLPLEPPKSTKGLSVLSQVQGDWAVNHQLPEFVSTKTDTKPALTGRVQVYFDKWMNDPTEMNLTYLKRALAEDGLFWRDLPLGPKGQRGSWTPFSKSETKAPSFEDWKRQLEMSNGVTSLPDAVLRGIYEKQKTATVSPPKSPVAPNDGMRKLVDGNKGLAKLREQLMDDRPLSEIAADLPNHKDIGVVTANTIHKMVNGRFTGKSHPLLSWASSNIHRIKNEATYLADQIFHGASRHNPSEGTYNYAWRKLNSKEREQVNKLGWALQQEPKLLDDAGIQAKAREHTGSPLNDAQLQAYKDRIRLNNTVLGHFNQFLKGEGRDVINARPHYWAPNTFEGPFITRFKNKATGETVKVHDSYTRPNIDALKKEFPDYEIAVDEIGVRGTTIPAEQMMWMLRHLDKEMRDPAARAIAEGLRRMGVSKHGMARRMVAGEEGTWKPVKHTEELTESYIRQVFDYMGNRKIDKLYNEVLGNEALDAHRNAKTLALESFDVARGQVKNDLAELGESLANGTRQLISAATLGKLHLPHRFLRDVLKDANRVKTTLLLAFANVGQITANLLQAPTYVPSSIFAKAADVGLSSTEAVSSLFRSSWEATKTLAAGEKKSADIQKLREIGALDATFRYDHSTYAADNVTDYKRTFKQHATGVSLLEGIETKAVRTPASLVYLHFLRDIGYADYLKSIGKSPDEIYWMAKELTDQYMVSNKWYEKAQMFSRTGLVGQAASPLQSFTTTWLGAFKEAVVLAGEGKPLPVATLLAMTLMTGGMVGMIGVKEWDMFAELMNKHLGTKMQTGTEWMLKNVKSNKLRFGLLSDALGWHIGSTFASPSLTNSAFPGVQFLANAGQAIGVGARETGMFGQAAKPTNAEKLEVLKGLVPRMTPIPGVSHGALEEHYMPKNAPVPNTAGRATSFKRGEDDWKARHFGMFSTKEVTAKAEDRTMDRTKLERASRMATTVDKLVDEYISDTPNQARIAELQQKLQADDPQLREVRQAIKLEVTRRYKPHDQALIGKGATSQQQKLYMLLQQLH